MKEPRKTHCFNGNLEQTVSVRALERIIYRRLKALFCRLGASGALGCINLLGINSQIAVGLQFVTAGVVEAAQGSSAQGFMAGVQRRDANGWERFPR